MQMDTWWECVWKSVCTKVVSWQGRGGQELLSRSRWVGWGRCTAPWARSGMGMCAHIYGGGIALLDFPWPQLQDQPLEAPLEPLSKLANSPSRKADCHSPALPCPSQADYIFLFVSAFVVD